MLTLIYRQFGRFVKKEGNVRVLIFYRLISHFINYLANIKVNKEIVMKDPNFLSARILAHKPYLQISSLFISISIIILAIFRELFF